MKKVCLFLPDATEKELKELVTQRIGNFGGSAQFADVDAVLEETKSWSGTFDLVAIWTVSEDVHSPLTKVVRLIELTRKKGEKMPIVFYYSGDLAPGIRRHLLSLAVTLPNGQKVEDFLRAIEAKLRVENQKVLA